jgi:hypothetical protein
MTRSFFTLASHSANSQPQYIQTWAAALIISEQKEHFLPPSIIFDFEDTTIVSLKKEN